jgi:peptidylprolyl isomerase
MRVQSTLLPVILACALSACVLSGNKPAASAPPASSANTREPAVNMANTVTTPSGLKYVDTVVGGGPTPRTGQIVTVHYTGRLADGTKFDSSLDRGQPFSFVIGTGQVIKGWDEGVATMRVGGKRRLIIPPALGYGQRGFSNVIPPNAELHFDVELLDVR